MNIHTLYQYNGLKPLINFNNRDDIEMNDYLKNGDMSCIIGLTSIHTISQINESSYCNDMDWGVENSVVSDGKHFMNSHTLSEENNHNPID